MHVTQNKTSCQEKRGVRLSGSVVTPQRGTDAASEQKDEEGRPTIMKMNSIFKDVRLVPLSRLEFLSEDILSCHRRGGSVPGTR